MKESILSKIDVKAISTYLLRKSMSLVSAWQYAPKSSFMVLGSAYAGIDTEAVAPLASYAREKDIDVVFHAGPIATAEEVGMYRFRMKKLKTWDRLKGSTYDGGLDEAEISSILRKAAEDLLAGVPIRDIDFDSLTDEDLEPEDIRYLQRSLRSYVAKATLQAEVDALKSAQEGRIRKLEEAMGKPILYLAGEMDVLDLEEFKRQYADQYMGTSYRISQYLGVTSMMANGPKVTGWPITSRIRKALGKMKHSWIMPHPVVQAESFVRPGLNNADNYFTTGRLSFAPDPTHTAEVHYAKHLPGAVIVYTDDDGSFFADNLIVERTDAGECFTAMDGKVFLKGRPKGTSLLDRKMSKTDEHAPHEHEGVMVLYKAVQGLYTPYTNVTLGDTASMDSVSRHLGGRPGSMEGQRLKNDLDGLRGVLDISKGNGVNILVDSNHHDWLDQFNEVNPQLKGLMDWETISKDYPEWKFVFRTAGEQEIYQWKDITGRHGDKETPEKAEEVFIKYEGGHYHRFRRLGHTVSLGAACFLPGTMVRTITGTQAIEEVQAGTLLYGKTGKVQAVVSPTSRDYVGKVVNIRTRFSPKGFTATANHLFYRMDNYGEGSWVRADALKRSDRILTSARKGLEQPVQLSHGRHLKGQGERQLTLRSDNTEDMWVLGLWLAEGSKKDKVVTFSLHEKETAYISRVENWAKLKGFTSAVRTRKDSKGVAVEVYSALFAELLDKYMGHTICDSKHIPVDIMEASVAELRPLVEGYFDGDGCYYFKATDHKKSGEYKQLCISNTTVSGRLNEDMTEILRRAGFQYTTTTHSPKGKRPFWSTKLAGDNAVHFHQWLKEGAHASEPKEVWDRITDVTHADYSGTVYCLSMPDTDTTFCLEGGVVTHNCKLGPKYLGGSLTAWQNQITTATAYKGLGHTAAKTVIHRGGISKTVFDGMIIAVELAGSDK